MSSMCYQTLSFVECLEILRQAKAVRAAFFDGHAPYVVPMGFEWFVNGLQPVVCLMMPKEGRKAEALSVCTQVCLEFEPPDPAAIQVVLAEGKAVPLHEEDGAMVYAIPVETMSGRRYFLPDD